MEDEDYQLRKLRGRLAYKKQVKPYVIFSDVNLTALLEAKPKTLEALGKVKGFGGEGRRVAGWGQSIIDIFNNLDKIEDFEVELDKDGELISKTRMRKMELF